MNTTFSWYHKYNKENEQFLSGLLVLLFSHEREKTLLQELHSSILKKNKYNSTFLKMTVYLDFMGMGTCATYILVYHCINSQLLT